jgi:hypothetical protein
VIQQLRARGVRAPLYATKAFSFHHSSGFRHSAPPILRRRKRSVWIVSILDQLLQDRLVLVNMDLDKCHAR